MPRFLNTSGQTVLGIGICARCSKKFPLAKLQPDRNSPGLMVCEKDNDVLDPYRLPPRQPDAIALPFTRPDIGLNVPTEVDEFDALETEDLLYGVETEDDQFGIKVES